MTDKHAHESFAIDAGMAHKVIAEVVPDGWRVEPHGPGMGFDGLAVYRPERHDVLCYFDTSWAGTDYAEDREPGTLRAFVNIRDDVMETDLPDHLGYGPKVQDEDYIAIGKWIVDVVTHVDKKLNESDQLQPQP